MPPDSTDADLTRSAHRLQRILDEVEKGLLKPLPVRREHNVRRNLGHDLHIESCFALEEQDDLVEQGGQQHVFALDRFDSGKIQQRADDVARPYCLLFDLLQQFLAPRRVVFLDFLLQDLGREKSIRERIIQFVRHTSQHGAQRGKFLGTQEHFLAQFEFVQHVIEGVADGNDLPIFRGCGKPVQAAAGNGLHTAIQVLEWASNHTRQRPAYRDHQQRDQCDRR